MKEAATITHPQPPSSTFVDGAMVLMLLLPSGNCDSFDGGGRWGGGGSPGKDVKTKITPRFGCEII